MKTGRAALWAARIFRWKEDNPGSIKFASWDKFHEEFRTEFRPVHVDQAAINRLESVAYFQSKRSVDDYIDEFLDLISEAGYTDPKTIVAPCGIILARQTLYGAEGVSSVAVCHLLLSMIVLLNHFN